MQVLDHTDPAAVTATRCVQTGDYEQLRQLLTANAELATARIRDERDSLRSLLHIATDWPGHFPNTAATIRVLVEAGADIDARFVGAHRETPLHWAASSNDVAAIDALLDAGASIDAPGGVIANGTPITDAAAFGQWAAAARLLERGASTGVWESAALGLLDRLRTAGPLDPEAADGAFWGACHGGQLETAQYLRALGADPHRRSAWDNLTPLEAARRSVASRPESDRSATTAVVVWLESLTGGMPAREQAK